MDAFEQLVCQIFHGQGYWTEPSYKIDLTKQQKAATGKPSRPRPEIDLLAYRPSTGEILAIECKSFLDSRGVQFAELAQEIKSTKYKLFVDRTLREVVLEALKAQLLAKGLCKPTDKVRLCLVAGRVKVGDSPKIAKLFSDNGWGFFDPSWVRTRIVELAEQGYTNQVSSVVAKLLLKPQP